MGLVKLSVATKSKTLSDFYRCAYNKNTVILFEKKITSVPIFRTDSATWCTLFANNS